MDALATVAAMAEPLEPSGAAAVALAAPAGKSGAAAWEFPVFMGHRRRLAPDAELFEAGNIEREQLARQAAVAAVHDERRQLSKEAELAGAAQLAGLLAVTSFECAQCHACLPTARLLELHVSELHDSFFAAQAARRMSVYQCLVEGCPRKFSTVEERKQHLTDHHKFPRNFHFDRIHLRRRKAQIRPLPAYQKGGHRRQAMEAEGEDAAAAAGTPSGAASAAQAVQHAAVGAGAEEAQGAREAGQRAQREGTQEARKEDVVAGMSRLSMAAESSSVPSVIHFGRGRGRALAGVPFGRGGGKAPGRGGAGTGGRHAAPPPARSSS